MIGLKDLENLIQKHENVQYIRAFASNVLEMNMLAGNPIEIFTQYQYYIPGIVIGHNNSIKFTIKHLVGETTEHRAHLLDNGILEVHSGPVLGGIEPWEAVSKSEKILEGKDEVCAIVKYEENGSEKICLYSLYKDGRIHWWLRTTEESPKEPEDEELLWYQKALLNHECIHSLERSGFTGPQDNPTVFERCIFCGEETKRTATDEEAKQIFSDFFENHGTNDPYREFKDIIELMTSDHPVDIMNMAEELECVYEDRVRIVTVDDEAFATSYLVIIDHEDDKDGYWGTSVIHIPQCMGNMSDFFMYPEHRKGLMSALSVIDEKERKYRDTDSQEAE